MCSVTFLNIPTAKLVDWQKTTSPICQKRPEMRRDGLDPRNKFGDACHGGSHGSERGQRINSATSVCRGGTQVRFLLDLGSCNKEHERQDTKNSQQQFMSPLHRLGRIYTDSSLEFSRGGEDLGCNHETSTPTQFKNKTGVAERSVLRVKPATAPISGAIPSHRRLVERCSGMQLQLAKLSRFPWPLAEHRKRNDSKHRSMSSDRG